MILRKKKLCKGKGKAVGYGCNEEKYIYGHGLCQMCYNIFKASNQRSDVKKRKPTGELKLFLEIYNERELKSFITERPIIYKPYDSRFVNCFAHVLPKSKYPKFRLNKNNIVLLTPYEHYLYDYGCRDQKLNYAVYADKRGYDCDWNKLLELREELKSQYVL